MPPELEATRHRGPYMALQSPIWAPTVTGEALLKDLLRVSKHHCALPAAAHHPSHPAAQRRRMLPAQSPLSLMPCLEKNKKIKKNTFSTPNQAPGTASLPAVEPQCHPAAAPPSCCAPGTAGVGGTSLRPPRDGLVPGWSSPGPPRPGDAARPGGAQGNEGARCRERRWLLVGVGGIVFPALITPPRLTAGPASCSEHPGGAGAIKSPLEYAPGVRGAPPGSKHPLPQTKPPELLQIFIGGGKKQKMEGPGLPRRCSAATQGDPSWGCLCAALPEFGHAAPAALGAQQAALPKPTSQGRRRDRRKGNTGRSSPTSQSSTS